MLVCCVVNSPVCRCADARERDYLKLAVHRMYGRCVHLRAYMKDQMGFILQEYVATQRPVSGIPEMLEILGSIVNGFAVPLKATNIDFLMQVLLPLVKVSCGVELHLLWIAVDCA